MKSPARTTGIIARSSSKVTICKLLHEDLEAAESELWAGQSISTLPLPPTRPRDRQHAAAKHK